LRIVRRSFVEKRNACRGETDANVTGMLSEQKRLARYQPSVSEVRTSTALGWGDDMIVD
jgi:hypothetical protein